MSEFVIYDEFAYYLVLPWHVNRVSQTWATQDGRKTYIIYPLDSRLELCQSKVDLHGKHNGPILLAILSDLWLCASAQE